MSTILKKPSVNKTSKYVYDIKKKPSVNKTSEYVYDIKKNLSK